MGTGSLLKTASHRRGLLTVFPATRAHQGNIFGGNQINLNPILNALRTRLSVVKMFSIDWDRDSQGSEPFVDVAQQPASFHIPTMSLELKQVVVVFLGTSCTSGLPGALFWNC